VPLADTAIVLVELGLEMPEETEVADLVGVESDGNVVDGLRDVGDGIDQRHGQRRRGSLDRGVKGPARLHRCFGKPIAQCRERSGQRVGQHAKRFWRVDDLSHVQVQFVGVAAEFDRVGGGNGRDRIGELLQFVDVGCGLGHAAQHRPDRDALLPGVDQSLEVGFDEGVRIGEVGFDGAQRHRGGERRVGVRRRPVVVPAHQRDGGKADRDRHEDQ
jgi:hypothetical protein